MYGYIYSGLIFVTWWGGGGGGGGDWGTADAERAHMLFIRAYL